MPPPLDLDAPPEEVRQAGIKFAMDMINQMPKNDRLALEAHITGVLIVFWGALWGTFGSEYATGFIEAQLRGMKQPDPDVFTRSAH